MKEKIESILERLYAIKDDDKFYFMTYGKDWIEELCEVSQQRELLIDFVTWQTYSSNLGIAIEDRVDIYLKSKNRSANNN